MLGSNCETERQICDDNGSSILVFYWSYNYSGQITASDCVDILGSQMHSVVQMFPNKGAIFQDDSSPYTQPEVCSVGLRSMKMHFNIFLGQHNDQT